jgi:hypothetical protein
MTTDNKRDPNDVLSRFDKACERAEEHDDASLIEDLEIIAHDLASALRDALAERRIGESYLQHLRAKLDKAEGVIACGRAIAEKFDPEWFTDLRAALSAWDTHDKEPRDGHE